MSERQEFWLGMARNILATALICLSAGCATAPKPKTAGYFFYPSLPDPPRLQFLVSYSGTKDLGKTPKSSFATFVTGEEPPQERMLKPYGAVFRNGQLFVCDTAKASVAVLEPAKHDMHYFAPTGEAALQFPVNIAIDTDGTRYVTDTGRNQVVIYGADESYLGAIGEVEKQQLPPEKKPTKEKKGSASSVAKKRAWESARMRPSDVAIFKNRLFMTDLVAHCVHVYDKESHKQLFTIPRDPKDPKASLAMPTNLALDSQGRVYVSDLIAFRVQQYDAEGNFLRTFGAGVGDRPGQFARPKGIAVDQENRLYVVDTAAQVVQIFDAEGRLLLFFGAPDPKKDEPSLFLPAKVVINYENVGIFQQYAAPDFQLEYLVIVTNQFGKRLVSIYGFGHKKS